MTTSQGWFQATVGIQIHSRLIFTLLNLLDDQVSDGARSSSAREYIAPVLSRSNLDVVVNTQATKIVQTGTQDGLPVLNGVQFAQSADGMPLHYFVWRSEVTTRTFAGPVYSLNASREVLLCAGPIKSPHLRKCMVYMSAWPTHNSYQRSLKSCFLGLATPMNCLRLAYSH